MNKKEKERIKKILNRVLKQAKEFLAEGKESVPKPVDMLADSIIVGISSELNIRVSPNFLHTITEAVEVILDILDITDAKDISEFRDECKDIELEPDVYTSDLTAWLNEDENNVNYLTDAIKEFGITDGFQAISQAQAMWKYDIYLVLLESVIKHRGDAE